MRSGSLLLELNFTQNQIETGRMWFAFCWTVISSTVFHAFHVFDRLIKWLAAEMKWAILRIATIYPKTSNSDVQWINEFSKRNIIPWRGNFIASKSKLSWWWWEKLVQKSILISCLIIERLIATESTRR